MLGHHRQISRFVVEHHCAQNVSDELLIACDDEFVCNVSGGDRRDGRRLNGLSPSLKSSISPHAVRGSQFINE
jgi:hypothetical protein